MNVERQFFIAGSPRCFPARGGTQDILDIALVNIPGTQVNMETIDGMDSDNLPLRTYITFNACFSAIDNLY
ncbi:hypothetical protein PR048_002278 [Dryococelus australis]|uniref:Uncharacterized protein n=1 Tax=Dryococelus australis TaxID=614101 RepID=A0ABQ9IKG4_9NEOP|nr:hypothetical protein PR048_002278 [Dryococelus australis]